MAIPVSGEHFSLFVDFLLALGLSIMATGGYIR
jgi:hypothetical protein